MLKALNSSDPLHIFVLLVLLILSTGSFWIFYEANNSIGISDIETKRDNWSKLELKDYSYTFVHGCMFVESVNVKISNRLVLQGRYENTIDYLFEQSKRAILSADRFNIEFHPLGFPIHLSVDWDKSVMDDECSYSIEDFEVLVNKAL